jgi:hypothetical protein
MHKRSRYCALIAGVAVLAAAHAEPPLRTPAIPARQDAQPSPQRVRVPSTDYVVQIAARAAPARGSLPSPALLNAVTTWLAIHFDLPRNVDLPAIRLEPGRRITTFRYTGMLSDHPRDMIDVPRGQRETVAAYDSLTRTIFLREGWSGSTAAELSVLVHEMVHHLQNAAGLRYECPQAAEQLAYLAQDKWLNLFGRDLAQDFEIDPFTLLVTTRCGA